MRMERTKTGQAVIGHKATSDTEAYYFTMKIGHK